MPKIIWFIIFIMFCMLIVVGCSNPDDSLKPTSCKAQIVEKVVVVGCPIKKVDCEFSGENWMPTKKLLECIKLQKLIIEECSQVIDEQVTNNQTKPKED